MAQPGFGGALDTPRTNIGDATYLSRAPDFADISQEASFQSPTKDGNFVQQLRNGRSNGVSIRTPRQRGPLADRRNLPPSVGGVEFTPMLKSATRNSVRRHGKENGANVPNTPALGKIDEDDITPIPRGETSMFTGSRSQSFIDPTTMPHVDSSAASTPLALPKRRGGDKGPLNDGNQLSLREQENVIDRIEKENFGLKLKIHFLEEALRKAGPGFSEAALKENTELKVDKVTMQRELHRYKKHLTTAERDLETYRQQMLELQEKAKRKYADENMRQEMESLRQKLDDREADIERLQRKLSEGQRDEDQLQKLRDDVEDLEAELREKDRLITERDDELEDLKDKCEDAEEKAKDAQRRMIEMEQAGQASEELEEAKDTIQELELQVRRLEEHVGDMKEKLAEASTDKERAENDLQELQEEMADKSMVTKGLSRQIEEKVARLQDDLDESIRKNADLETKLAESNKENNTLKSSMKDVGKQREDFDRQHQSLSDRIRELEAELEAQADEKDMLRSRYDSLSNESRLLQEEVAKLERELDEVEQSLEEEREHALGIEKDVRTRYTGEIERLNDLISDLQAEIREKDNLYDNDSEKWETEKQTLEAERQRAEEKAAGLQRTIDRLQEAEGALSDKESKLQAAIQSEVERHRSEEAILARQIDDLQDALETRQTLLTNLRNELSVVRDELRQSHIDCQSQADKIAALEDEVEVLQTTLDDEAGSGRQELQDARRECDSLRMQLKEAQRAAELAQRANATSERSPNKAATETLTRLKWELSDAQAKLDRATKEKQSLQDQLAKNDIELRAARSSLAETKAERDELHGELRRSKMHDNDTLRVDQERLDLRTAKMKLDSEVHRLKEENKALLQQRLATEKTLEEEIEKAAEEEERLNQEVLQLQTKLRQSSTTDNQELISARRTIRELERRIDDYQGQLTTNQFPADIEGNSELSMMRKDLSAARQKELEFLQRESGQREVVKGLKKQLADLERRVHEREISRLIESPGSVTSRSNRSEEAAQLRQQLTEALKSVHDLKSKNREMERQSSQSSQDLVQQLNDLEDQKIVLEEVLEQARQQAEEAAAQQERTLQRMKHKLDKAERERAAVIATASQSQASKHDRNLRKTQAEVENLEHDVRQQQDIIDALVASEGSLRRKLERARSERAAYRMSAEKLQRDVQKLKNAAAAAASTQHKQAAVAEAQKTLDRSTNEALETVIRAAEGAEERHKKELRGMVMQMEWMQARWQREASLRADAAYAKRFLQLQLDLAQACNKAQLRELEQIRTKLLGSRKALELPSSAGGSARGANATKKPSPLRTLLTAVRFIARMRMSAREWAKQEVVRQKLSVAVHEQRRAKRSRQLKVVRADA
ncbi:hypothetical protein B0I35DRAFT_509717 [Stachybotrys elegans]|uniref:Centrosomin N-terminal motif 1 domain-containing protein n=1 Tax=Stachybotrys elegans TaxID=80388 RepID=A0A8K0SWT2_9HYPO|nr:hypothetical protein B0I35DRAFT_509717 [Stachybotrys elegans]